MIIYYVLIENFEDSLSSWPNKLAIFRFSNIIRSENQKTLAAFCGNSKVLSSNFSMIKNIVASSFLVGLPMKLIYCLKSGFSNSVCLLKSIVIVWSDGLESCNGLESSHNQINCLLCNHYFFISIIYTYVSSLLFIDMSKKLLPLINTLKSFIWMFGT